MIIDLSLRLNENTPVYPGDPATTITVAAEFASQGYLGHSLSMGTHAGTHIDAPAHMLEGGKSLDKFPVGQFVGRGCYILVKGNRFSLDDVRAADISAGDIVVFHTEMSYKLRDEAYLHDYPAMTVEIARYLVERKVKMVGVDTCSVDNQPDFSVHKLLLGNDILIIENLTNLEQLHGMDATIYALPLKLDLDGAPARVIAEVR